MYAAQPRWRRWAHCGAVLPLAVPVAVRVRRFLRTGTSPAPAALPDFLQQLTHQPAWTPLLPGACAAVAHRLATRGRADRCLPRALLLYGLLQYSRAADVRFCLGVHPEAAAQPGAFAHAWVEAEGHPLGEGTDPRTTHRLLYRYPSDAPPSAPASSAAP